MAINLCCRNSRCKYWWENMCDLNVYERAMRLNEEGKCESFIEGKNEIYYNESIESEE